MAKEKIPLPFPPSPLPSPSAALLPAQGSAADREGRGEGGKGRGNAFKIKGADFLWIFAKCGKNGNGRKMHSISLFFHRIWVCFRRQTPSRKLAGLSSCLASEGRAKQMIRGISAHGRARAWARSIVSWRRSRKEGM